MKAWLKHPFRVTGRLLWLSGDLVLAAADFVFRWAFRPGKSRAARQAEWLQHHSRRLLRIFQVQPQVAGQVPSAGLLVCNHLSYLDILVLAACTPAVFVSKREIKYWPVFGWFACLCGTIFVDRERRTRVGRSNDEIQAALDRGSLVILFPEGTSSDGQTVLPFKSALLEPAARQTGPLSLGLIRYELDDGDVGGEICYWKDMTFVPHAINLLSKRTLRVFVRFAPSHTNGADRKELARQLHLEILKLKTAPPV